MSQAVASLSLHERAHRAADAFLGWVLLAHFPLALALAPLYGSWRTAILVGGLVSFGCFAATRLRPGALATRLAVGAGLMVYSALFIQETRGLIEMHFHIFVALAFLVAYRDWRVPMLAAAVTAVQHVTFYALQDAGKPIWIVNHSHGFWMIGVHAAFVVVEVIGLAIVAEQLRQSDARATRVVETAERIARGVLTIDADGQSDDAGLVRIIETLQALDAATMDVADRLRGVRRIAPANGTAPRSLDGIFLEITTRLANAATRADELHGSANADSVRARAFAAELTRVSERLIARDLTARVTGQDDGVYGDVSTSLNGAIEQLEAALGDVRGATHEIVGATTRVTDGSVELVRSATEQAASLETIAANLQELGAMAAQSSGGAVQARELSDAARTSTATGVEAMHRLAEAVTQIRRSANMTAKIVKTIDEIAFQTNLLALNAAVEAARAGDAGRGFAVVAEEVRALAHRSAEAAKQTNALIDESVRHTEAGAAMTDTVADRLREIDQRVLQVGDVIAEIAAASDQQRQGVDQINHAVEHMNALTRQTAASAESSADASGELSTQTARLQATVTQFAVSGHAVSRRRESPPSRRARVRSQPQAQPQLPQAQQPQPPRPRPAPPRAEAPVAAEEPKAAQHRRRRRTDVAPTEPVVAESSTTPADDATVPKKFRRERRRSLFLDN